MTDDIQVHPLSWPFGRPRLNNSRHSAFKITHERAVRFVIDEIRRLGGSRPIISTNIPLRNDGLPYANFRKPDDRAAAVYFTRRGKQMCFACDKWDQVHDNIYAIGKTIEALRGIERWGTGDMVEQAFDDDIRLSRNIRLEIAQKARHLACGGGNRRLIVGCNGHCNDGFGNEIQSPFDLTMPETPSDPVLNQNLADSARHN